MTVTDEAVDEIESILKELEITAARTLSDDAPYEFMVDFFEPTPVYAFSVEDILDVDDVVDDSIESGIIAVYEEQSGKVYACGSGQYDRVGGALFEPIHTHFGSA